MRSRLDGHDSREDTMRVRNRGSKSALANFGGARTSHRRAMIIADRKQVSRTRAASMLRKFALAVETPSGVINARVARNIGMRSVRAFIVSPSEDRFPDEGQTDSAFPASRRR